MTPASNASMPPPGDLPEDPTISYNRARMAGHSEATMGSTFPSGGSAEWSVVETADSNRPIADVLNAPTLESPSETHGASYELRRLIGRGGMGEVWEALQVSLNRVVAVKRIAPERDNKGLHTVERHRGDFRQEALVAAKLEHPNIVPVHDLGVDPAGSPLLAMKLVQGRNWEKLIYEDMKSLPFPDFLTRHVAILIDVSQAVAFAHSRGVIHRDLKPAQVMVGEFGEVLLMDWGLAVFAGVVSNGSGHDTPAIPGVSTLETASNPSGTPALMAPEQTERDSKRLGTHTDVYLLGGTLYFLLTQSYPHRAATASLAFEKAARGFVENPGDRVQGRELPAELVCIAMDALKAEPGERIAGAREFIRRLQEFQSGASRKRDSISLTTTVAGQLGSAAGDYRIYSDCLTKLQQARTLWPDNENTGLLEERALREHAEAALHNGDLVLARLQAERLSDSATRQTIMEAVDRSEASATGARRQRKVLAAAAIVLLLLHGVGVALFAWNQHKSKREIAIQRDKADLARAQAEAVITGLIDEIEPIVELSAGQSAVHHVTGLASGYYDKVDPHDMTRDSRINYASVYIGLAQMWSAVGDIEQSNDSANKGIKVLEELLDAEPGNRELAGRLASALNGRAYNIAKQDHVADAHADLQRSMKLTADPQDDPGLLAARAAALLNMSRLGLRPDGQDNSREQILQALDYYRKLAAIEEKKATNRGKTMNDVYGVGHALDLLAEDYVEGGEFEKAEAALKEMIVMVDRAAAETPAFVSVQNYKLNAYESYARLLFNQGRHAEAVDCFEKAEEAAFLVQLLDPADTSNMGNVVRLCLSEAHLYNIMGEPDRALAASDKSIQLLDKLLAQYPERISWLEMLCRIHTTRADIFTEARRWSDAEEEIRMAIEAEEKRLSLSPVEEDSSFQLAVAYSSLSKALAGQGDLDGAIKAQDHAIEIHTLPNYLADPQSPNANYDVAWDYHTLGRLREQNNESKAAQELYEKAWQAIQRAEALFPEKGQFLLSTKSCILMSLGRLDEARPIVQQLYEGGWRWQEFVELATEKGLLPPQERTIDTLEN